MVFERAVENHVSEEQLVDQIPPKEKIQEALRSAWQFDGSLIPVPGTGRLFSFKKNGATFFARLNWARGQFCPEEVVEFLNHLSTNDAPVPQIVPTLSGDLCIMIGDAVVLSVETDLGGEPCSSRHLHRLGAVGRGLAKIHLVSEKFEKSRMQKKDLTGFVEVRLRRALSSSLHGDLRDAIKTLQTELQTTYEHLTRTSVRWMTTHGDVWGPNVHTDGEKVGFTDLCNSFAPATVDLVMVQHRWLMNDLTGGRSLLKKEMLDFLRGYLSERPLSVGDRETFGVVWAAYYADQLSHYIEKPGTVRDAVLSRFDFEGQIRRLPLAVDEIRSLL